ncbi:MAG: ATP-dependent helicase, partial [Gemmatimonadaceae bacterium]
WGGLKFLEAAHVKDVLAFLRILENPRDEVSWYRVLQLLPGIGDATARRAIDLIASMEWNPAAIARVSPPPRAREAHGGLMALVGTLTGEGAGDTPVSAQIAIIRTFYDAILRERYDRVEPRLADLDQLEVIAGNFPSRADFLSQLALEPPSATQDLATGTREDDDCLILSTAHSAKGREWDAVFVIWAVDGWFPSSRALKNDEETEEERRLMYVATTRARDHLVVAYPLNVYSSRHGSDYSMDQVSRFIDRGVREKMRRIAAYGAPTSASPHVAPGAPNDPAPPIDLRALLRGRFS